MQEDTGPTRPTGAERRRWARAPADWTVTLALEDGKHQARMRDVSASGVCFFLDRPIPEMTLLGMELELPATDASPQNGNGRPLRCSGAVVRCRRISPHLDHWEVALFLHEITESDRAKLESWVAANVSE